LASIAEGDGSIDGAGAVEVVGLVGGVGESECDAFGVATEFAARVGRTASDGVRLGAGFGLTAAGGRMLGSVGVVLFWNRQPSTDPGLGSYASPPALL
jgi:hypothetical protein